MSNKIEITDLIHIIYKKIMKQKNIAIFGSTGHIGKNLISFFIKNNDFKIFLFSRDIKKFESLKMIFSDTMSFNTYDDFGKNEYDVIINCAGISNPNAFEKKFTLNI